MKALMITILAATGTLAAVAQAPKAYPVTADASATPAEYALPYTTVKVKVVMEKEVVRTGPYARFAQKYLGSIAPMNDKEIYSIKSAALDYTDPDRREALVEKPAGRRYMMAQEPDTEFPKVQIDRTSATDKAGEEAARAAAEMIFKLRRTRIDLITGEIGERVYGGGLLAALDEIDRLEREYTALFLGKTAVETVEKVFDVIPESGKTSYIVCRYSQSEGFLPGSDLSGSPVVLTLTPENKLAGAVVRADTKRAANIYRVADWVGCRVTDGNVDLAEQRIPIYQFGANVSGK